MTFVGFALHVMIAVVIVIVLISTFVVICVTIYAGRHRDWEEEDRLQMEALKEWKERHKKQD